MNNINKLHFGSFVEDFIGFGIDTKAKLTYYKCLKNRKFDIARKIKNKYNLSVGGCDLVTAFQLALSLKNN